MSPGFEGIRPEVVAGLQTRLADETVERYFGILRPPAEAQIEVSQPQIDRMLTNFAKLFRSGDPRTPQVSLKGSRDYFQQLHQVALDTALHEVFEEVPDDEAERMQLRKKAGAEDLRKIVSAFFTAVEITPAVELPAEELTRSPFATPIHAEESATPNEAVDELSDKLKIFGDEESQARARRAIELGAQVQLLREQPTSTDEEQQAASQKFLEEYNPLRTLTPEQHRIFRQAITDRVQELHEDQAAAQQTRHELGYSVDEHLREPEDE